MNTPVASDKTNKTICRVVCINCKCLADDEALVGTKYYECFHMTEQEWFIDSKEHKPIAMLVGWKNGSEAEKSQLRRWLVDCRDVPVILVANKKCDAATAVWALRNQFADYVEWPSESTYLAQRLAELAQKHITDCFQKAEALSLVASKVCGTQPAVDMIKQRYAEHLSLTMLAQGCGLSNISFARRFKHEHGMSPQNFLRNYRLHLAKLLLTQSPMSIKRIAAEVGFDDIAYFSRVFKKVEQCSPSQYRVRVRTQPATEPTSLVQRIAALSTRAKLRSNQRSDKAVRQPMCS